MAVFAEGSTVTLDQVFLGALRNGARSGRALVVERSLPAGKPATASVSRSIIERASDAAIDVRDATVTLDQTTIFDTNGRVGDGCSGQAIRIRTLPTGDSRGVLQMTDSTITKSRLAGVFATASTVNLARDLVRDVTPNGTEGTCIQAMGDGVALEQAPGQDPTDATFDHVRIEGVTRAAIATNGANVSMDSTLLACNAKHVVDVTGLGRTSPASGAVCGCERKWSSCSKVPEPLTPWINSGPSPVWPDEGQFTWRCLADFFSQSTPLTGVALWSDDMPEVQAAPTGIDGCAWAPWSVHDMWKPGYIVSRSPLGFLAIGALTIPLNSYTSINWPMPGTRLIYNGVPAPSHLSVSDLAIIFTNGGAVLPNGDVPTEYWSIYVVPEEPGWSTVMLTPPAGVVCMEPAPDSPMPLLGPLTQPNARFVRAEWGYSAGADFRDCVAPP
jgi:hypothetical protein